MRVLECDGVRSDEVEGVTIRGEENVCCVRV